MLVAFITSSRTGDFLLEVIPIIGGFFVALDVVVRGPSQARKSRAEGNTYATEDRVRRARRYCIALMVFALLVILFLTCGYIAGWD
jgi:hypothetical protein